MLYGLQYAAKMIYNVKYDNKRTLSIRCYTCYLYENNQYNRYDKMK